jgi:hypothetical protein
MVIREWGRRKNNREKLLYDFGSVTLDLASTVHGDASGRRRSRTSLLDCFFFSSSTNIGNCSSYRSSSCNRITDGGLTILESVQHRHGGLSSHPVGRINKMTLFGTLKNLTLHLSFSSRLAKRWGGPRSHRPLAVKCFLVSKSGHCEVPVEKPFGVPGVGSIEERLGAGLGEYMKRSINRGQGSASVRFLQRAVESGRGTMACWNCLLNHNKLDRLRSPLP